MIQQFKTGCQVFFMLHHNACILSKGFFSIKKMKEKITNTIRS